MFNDSCRLPLHSESESEQLTFDDEQSEHEQLQLLLSKIIIKTLIGKQLKGRSIGRLGTSNKKQLQL